MALRVAVGGFLHESTTFVDRPTAWEDFARTGPWPGACEGEAMLRTFDGLNLGLAGFVDEARKAGHEIAPVAWTMAQPGGPVTAQAFERMSAALVDGYRRSGADVIFCELHGAMVAESYDDAEGELLRRIRAVVGPGVPILGTLDLHVNMSDAMVAHANLLSAFRTYPHVDWAETGARVARWLDRVIAWGPAPAKAMRRMPFLVPVTAGCSMISPAKELYRALEAIEAESGVHLNFTPGFPPADIADCGPAVFGYGADEARVQRAVDRLADLVDAAEPQFAAQRVQPVGEAVANAIRIAGSADKPVVLADTQDNPGAGAPSNTTGIIAELLAQGAEGAIIGILHDPDAAAAAHAAGLGAHLNIPLGAPAQPGPWTVVALSDGHFAGTAPMLRSKFAEMGKTAVLKQNGVEVLVATIRQQPIHRETFSHLGIDPRDRKIVALKSSVHFRAGFQEIASEVITCASPGMNLADPADFSYQKLPAGIRRRPRA
ncbi:MAG TPA: M81 family metallopeptidase [Xanthobacteraceae bacterium]|nr:M81 family metallopeptidase [Xanthobacteraceae bacterium]